MKKNLRHNIIIVLMLLATAIIVTISLPRAGRESLEYEEGQPWRYSLLTAPFDIPEYYDSDTEERLSDSIRTQLPPYVNLNADKADEVINSFPVILAKGQPGMGILERQIRLVYNKGIVSDDVEERLSNQNSGRKSVMVVSASTIASKKDASDMLTVDDALHLVKTGYEAEANSFAMQLTPSVWDNLNRVMQPNVTLNDSVDARQMNNELSKIKSAKRTIRQGERIVDRGEVVTPQVYRNLQEYERILTQEKGTSQDMMWFMVGQALYIIIVLVAFYFYLAYFRERVFASTKSMVFIMTSLLVTCLIAVALSSTIAGGIYLTPFAALPVVIMLFVDRRTALTTLFAATFVGAVVAIYQFQFIFYQICAGMTALLCLKQLSKRSQLLSVSFFTFFVYCLCYTVMTLMTEGSLSELSIRVFIYFGVNSALLSLTYVLIFVIERLFGFTSTVTLVELSDINTPLLRRLSEEAPGTFQHSMQVSTLASDAARAIGADTQLVRTGALYHDIGKLSSPIFFTENQHGVNPHDGLDPETSARKIISHVTEGVAMAQKAKLPTVIKNFILEHHGKGVTRYFYNTACNNHGGEMLDPTPFTYPGPNPQSRETAILMMADAVEAASRSLPEYSEQTISALVDRIIDGQVAEGMFRESPLSFSDIEMIKDVFKRRLGTIYHSRVAYPTIKK